MNPCSDSNRISDSIEQISKWFRSTDSPVGELLGVEE
jgi:hypothetical protein